MLLLVWCRSADQAAAFNFSWMRMLRTGAFICEQRVLPHSSTTFDNKPPVPHLPQSLQHQGRE